MKGKKGGRRAGMRVAGNPVMFTEAEKKIGTAKRGGRVKRARDTNGTRDKDLGTINGGAVRQRLARPARGRVQRRIQRDDAGVVPGASRENLDPRIDAIVPAESVVGSRLLRVAAPIAYAIRRGPDYTIRQISGTSPAGEPYVSDDVIREYYARQGQRSGGGRSPESERARANARAETAQFAHAGSGAFRRGGRISRRRNG